MVLPSVACLATAGNMRASMGAAIPLNTKRHISWQKMTGRLPSLQNLFWEVVK